VSIACLRRPVFYPAGRFRSNPAVGGHYPARARTIGGTGLGLAISLEDAHLHGGWLQAWGERGRGSVFRLTLPRVARAPLAGSPLPLGPDEAEIVTGLGGTGPFPAVADGTGPFPAVADGTGPFPAVTDGTEVSSRG